MNIYDFAMQMEKDGENYYRELAANSKMAGLKTIFDMLADEEVKHFKIFQDLKQQGNVQISETAILDDVKNIFLKMKDDKPELHIDTTADTNAFRKARDIEEKSRDFYLAKAEETEDPAVRKLLEKVANEEGKHLRIMESLVDFVSQPEPGNWLENAEWTHLEEY